MTNSVQRVEVRTGRYADSVTLMEISRRLSATSGVTNAQVAMATELNLEVLRGLGFVVPDGLAANDLVVAVLAADEAALSAGFDAATAALAERGSRGPGGADVGLGGSVPPRTLGSAIRRGGGNLAVVSVPGAYASVEALDGVEAGASVMLFSDNVSLAQEVLLKEAAAAADVLVMGPDCGTAAIGGVAFGFANVVRPGTVGLVAASGTGAQQVMCLLDAAGLGVMPGWG